MKENRAERPQSRVHGYFGRRGEAAFSLELESSVQSKEN